MSALGNLYDNNENIEAWKNIKCNNLRCNTINGSDSLANNYNVVYEFTPSQNINSGASHILTFNPVPVFYNFESNDVEVVSPANEIIRFNSTGLYRVFFQLNFLASASNNIVALKENSVAKTYYYAGNTSTSICNEAIINVTVAPTLLNVDSFRDGVDASAKTLESNPLANTIIIQKLI